MLHFIWLCHNGPVEATLSNKFGENLSLKERSRDKEVLDVPWLHLRQKKKKSKYDRNYNEKLRTTKRIEGIKVGRIVRFTKILITYLSFTNFNLTFIFNDFLDLRVDKSQLTWVLIAILVTRLKKLK